MRELGLAIILAVGAAGFVELLRWQARRRSPRGWDTTSYPKSPTVKTRRTVWMLTREDDTTTE
jgi:hypothetical protein